MLRNEEFRSLLIKMLVFQVVFAISILLVTNLFFSEFKEKLVIRNSAMAGGIIDKYPELEDKIISYITGEISQENIEKGQVFLEEYGYSKDIFIKQEPLLKKQINKTYFILISILIFSLIPLLLILIKEYGKIYTKVNKVSTAAELVVEGDFSLSLDEEGEGDFYILNHKINQMANRLENSLSNLEREKVFLKETISDISHQLKTPLSSLIVFNELLLEEQDMDKQVRLDFLEKTKNQLDRMEWLIINLLKLARIEAGAIDFKHEKVLLKDSLDTALEVLAPVLKEQEVLVSGDKETHFQGDLDWTREALVNIIKNASEYSKGKIYIELEDSILFSTIRIRDNGEGIEREDLPHIFKRFYKTSDQVKADSIGIGLSLAKLIIEAQEGTISVKSESGEGTEFTLSFLKK